MDTTKFSGNLQSSRKTARSISRGYVIDHARRLVLVQFFGILTARDIVNYADALRQDPHFDHCFSEIVDLTAVEQVEISPAEAIKLADATDPFEANAWRAFVTCKDVQTNVARMHKILRSPAKNIAIFDTVSKAEQWVLTASLRPADGRSLVVPFPSRRP